MGQLIAVEPRVVEDLLLLSCDRSLTGQDGVAFESADQAAAGTTPPGVLTRRLFAGDTAIDHVYVHSSEVVVRRRGGWDQDSINTASHILSNLFVFNEQVPSDPTQEAPVGGEGRSLELKRTPSVTGAELSTDAMETLRAQHYNATIAYLEEVHENLWILGVLPHDGMLPYEAGQYATLGMGYWEPRIDNLREELTAEQTRKLARRSYSISSPIFGDDGHLLDPAKETALEFYVVLVERDWRGAPAVLTPRLFLKGEGDTLFVGRKVAGRYRLDRVADPTADLFFLSTGTGEAPHNRMVLELLRQGHTGRIVSACTARYWQDLAYLDKHRELESQFSNYRYFPMTTREPENQGNKIYIQGLIESGLLEEDLGLTLDPSRTHFFLCGNPAMIGLPEWDEDGPTFPETRGVAEILVERGFTLDHRRTVGNIHYEEYW
jgi:ferredoxin--NADP+ reductase